jgi:AcrR family transcriptional regulator
VPPQTPRLLALALDPAVEAPDDALAARILDAALELAAASGLRHLTMDDVAQRAGVGRMTVYRRFGGRATLVDALAVRECRRCLARIADAIDPAAPAVAQVAAMAARTLRVTREHPLLARLARVEPTDLLIELTRDDSAVVELVIGFLMERLSAARERGEIAGTQLPLLAELAVRLGASFVLLPRSALPLEDEAATREAIASLLAPLLVSGGRADD